MLQGMGSKRVGHDRATEHFDNTIFIAFCHYTSSSLHPEPNWPYNPVSSSSRQKMGRRGTGWGGQSLSLVMKLLVSKRSDLAGVRWVGEGISGATRVISNPVSLSSNSLEFVFTSHLPAVCPRIPPALSLGQRSS